MDASVDDLKNAAEAASRVIEVEVERIDPGQEPGAKNAAGGDGGANEAMWEQFSLLFVNVVLDSLAARSPKWKPKEGEAERIASALGPVLDKYVPDVFNRFGPEMALAFAIGAFAVPRLQVKDPPKAKRDDVAGDVPNTAPA